MRRTLAALTALAVLSVPAAFAADAMMKKESPAMMEKSAMTKPSFTPYVQGRLDALVEKIATGTKKEANLRWLKSSLAKSAPGSRNAEVYAYLLEKIEWYGKDAMMKKEDAMMEKPGTMMDKAGAAMEKPANDSGAMMKKDDGAMMSAGTYAAYDAQAVKAALAAGKTPVLFFHAAWCPTCRSLDKTLMGQAAQLPGSVTVFKVDYDDSADLKKAYGVRMQHTLVALRADGTFASAAGTVSDVAGVKKLVEGK